jgi:hypothetical protein
MKYAIIETWNGEGYSSENLAYIEDYNSDAEAQQRLKDLVSIQSDAKNIVESDGLISYDKGDDDCLDNGTFQFIKNAESIYGVVILTNENEAIPCDKKRWRKFRTEALAQCNPDDIDELDLSADDFFIGAYESDYDYQFVKFEK